MTATRPVAGTRAAIHPVRSAEVQEGRRELVLHLPTRSQVAAGGLELAGVVGALLIAFSIFQAWVSDVSQERAQRSLARAFDERVSVAEVLSTSGSAAEVESLSKPVPGDAVAVLRIPRLDLEQVVVEGSGSKQLQGGPGHLRSTPLPGERGNAVVLGHRTTYGEPFARLDDLRRNDRIEVATPLANYTFRVRSIKRVVPGKPDPVTARGGRAITLVTSDPPHRASGRLVVVAEAPGGMRLADATAGRAERVSSHERGLRPDSGAWAPALLWGVALSAAYAMQRWLRRTWTRPTAWLVSAPVLLALAFVWFEQLNRLLPSTL